MTARPVRPKLVHKTTYLLNLEKHIDQQDQQIKELKVLLKAVAYGEPIAAPHIMNERIKQALKK